jgi:hypothetical protein
MARVPTIAEEDAKRPNRERDCLVGERTRIVNRIKSSLLIEPAYPRPRFRANPVILTKPARPAIREKFS